MPRVCACDGYHVGKSWYGIRGFCKWKKNRFPRSGLKDNSELELTVEKVIIENLST